MSLRSTSFTQITADSQIVQAKTAKSTIESWWTELAGKRVHAAYIHVPFCFHKCHYCDFYSIVDSQDRQAAFVERLISEMKISSEIMAESVQSIFIGGGTPTLLKVDLWKRLLDAIHEHIPMRSAGEVEFTVECNPETMTEELAGTLAAGGVNRVSIGCQSFNPAHLKTLERWHDPLNVERSVGLLRSAGITKINLDLIFAIPGQTVDEWLTDLNTALSLNPSHMSCYGLVYEPNTPMTVKMRAGQITPCEQEIEAEMYSTTIKRLAGVGFEHYEISNWAKSDNRCQHNMAYWTNRNWWPLGPSASGHMDGLRWKNVGRLGEYLDHGPLPNVADVERLDEDGRIGEQFMLGLRLIDGLPLDRVESLLAGGKRGDARRVAITRHLQTGLLQQREGHLQLAADGLLVADTVLADLI